MSNGKWMYEIENAEIWRSDEEFDTREEAIVAGRKHFQEMKLNGDYEDYEYFEVGQKIHPSVAGVNVDGVLDFVAQQMYDEVGEVAEDFLMHVAKDDYRVLEERLDSVFFAWLEEFNYNPNFFKIMETEKVSIKD